MKTIIWSLFILILATWTGMTLLTVYLVDWIVQSFGSTLPTDLGVALDTIPVPPWLAIWIDPVDSGRSRWPHRRDNPDRAFLRFSHQLAQPVDLGNLGLGCTGLVHLCNRRTLAGRIIQQDAPALSHWTELTSTPARYRETRPVRLLAAYHSDRPP